LFKYPRLLNTGKYFKESNNYIKSGSFPKAIELLEELSRSSVNEIAKKARQNLATAWEAAGAR
jgi:hypothetical protein